jgi:hypothetical protein
MPHTALLHVEEQQLFYLEEENIVKSFLRVEGSELCFLR